MKGLSFSEPMVQPWMEGRKTVTRRLIGGIDPSFFIRERRSAENLYLFTKMAADEENQDGTVGVYIDKWIKPRYLPGETVYIKETWDFRPMNGGTAIIGYKSDSATRAVIVPSGFKQLVYSTHRWRSPLFMPEFAARSHALIVSVRPERVQEITEDEAQKEGVAAVGAFLREGGNSNVNVCHLYGFIKTWDTLYPGSWERNDWVWRIELEKTG